MSLDYEGWERTWDTFGEQKKPIGGNIGDEYSTLADEFSEQKRLEESTRLEEMARVCKKKAGFGIVVDIYSRDHGGKGNSEQPAHAHLFDTNMRPKGQFVLTQNIPKKPNDIIWYRTDNPPVGYAEKIVRWANSRSSRGLNNWLHALQTWDDSH
jgi:hypothetical protein